MMDFFPSVKTKFNLPFDLTSAQQQGIIPILSGTDVILVLPTGSGKSVVSYLPPLLLNEQGEVLTKRPENVRDFAADWFTNPQFPDIVQSQLEQRDRSLREAKFNRKL